MIFFINPPSTYTHLGLKLICDVWLLNKNSIKLNWNLYKLLPFCPCHFVPYHFFRSPFALFFHGCIYATILGKTIEWKHDSSVAWHTAQNDWSKHTLSKTYPHLLKTKKSHHGLFVTAIWI